MTHPIPRLLFLTLTLLLTGTWWAKAGPPDDGDSPPQDAQSGINEAYDRMEPGAIIWHHKQCKADPDLRVDSPDRIPLPEGQPPESLRCVGRHFGEIRQLRAPMQTFNDARPNRFVAIQGKRTYQLEEAGIDGEAGAWVKQDLLLYGVKGLQLCVGDVIETWHDTELDVVHQPKAEMERKRLTKERPWQVQYHGRLIEVPRGRYKLRGGSLLRIHPEGPELSYGIGEFFLTEGDKKGKDALTLYLGEGRINAAQLHSFAKVEVERQSCSNGLDATLKISGSQDTINWLGPLKKGGKAQEHGVDLTLKNDPKVQGLKRASHLGLKVEIEKGKVAVAEPFTEGDGALAALESLKSEAQGVLLTPFQRCPAPRPDLPGFTWVPIPGGTFTMGSNNGDEDEKPPHEVTVPGFCMAKTEVTVTQYRACVEAGACSTPDSKDDSSYCNWGYADRDTHPINCVDWEQAEAFATWAGGRLPSEAQWEYAARGEAGRTYPWGNGKPSCERAIYDPDGAVDNGCGENRTWPVCSVTAGNTPEGLCDMAGNVWEWVADPWHDTYEGAPSDGRVWSENTDGSVRFLRGGSWNNDAGRLRGSYRFWSLTGVRGRGNGFRVASPRGSE